MKNLLAHFRRKPSETADAPAPPAEPPKAKAAPIEPVRMPTAVARAIKPAWHAPGASFPQKQRASALADRPAATEMVTLRLGDFLDRIPAELLDEGAHDRSIPMPFDLSALSERIGRGDTTIRLTEVYRRMPDVFRPNAVIGQDRMIPFPWKKVLAMIQEAKAGGADGGITPSGVEMLAVKFKARKLRQPSKTAPGATGGAEAGGPASTAKSGETPAPAFSLARSGRMAASASLAESGGTGGLIANVTSASAAALEMARLTAERDTAVARAAEFGAEYESMIARTGELTAERDAALARAAELVAERAAAAARVAEPASESAAAAARIVELTAERDAALARAAKLVADSDAAMALTTELSAERDAAKAQVAALTGERDAAAAGAAAVVQERDAAVTRASELTTEREAALAHMAEATAERDAAVARTAKFLADSDAAVALATELTAERDAANGRIAAVTAERDAAVARATELTAEREAAAARVAELLQLSETSAKAAAEAPVKDDSSAVLEGCRDTIAVLTRERDALRLEQQQLTARLAESASLPKAVADKKVKPPVQTNEPLPDAYSALFPQRLWMPRAAAAVVLGFLGIGVASQTDLGAARDAGAETPAAASPAPEETFTLPTLPPANLAESEFTLEAAVTEEPVTTPSPEPLSGGPAEQFSDNPNQIVWKPIPSRLAR